MKKFARPLAVAAATTLLSIGVVSTAAPAQAMDTSWGYSIKR